MQNVLIESSTMEGIGEAIRKKTGKIDKIYPRDMPEAITGIGMTKEEADKRYLRLVGGTLEPTSKIAQTNGQWSWKLDASALTFANKQPDGVEYCMYIGADSFGWGSNEISNCIYENYATLGSVTLMWDWFGTLNLGVAKLDGIPTVTDADKDSPDYAAQNSDAASVWYVRAALEAQIGDINSVLDAINGEEV